jgi:uncharacterized protein YkwD
LREGGADVPVWLTTPEKPVAEGYQRNTVCLAARQPLKPGTRYEVRVSATVNGEAWAKAWGFRTRAEEPEGAGAIEALARVNQLRRDAGLMPVVLDDELTRGCQLHARYLLRNLKHPATQGLGIHDEDPKLPGYTAEGKKAGGDSVIASGIPPLAAIDDWVATFYHRVPLLDPELRRIGYGHTRGGGPGGWFVVLNAVTGRDGAAAVVYPADGQKNVPARGADGEGYPITVAFVGAVPEQIEIAMQDGDGKEVAVRAEVVREMNAAAILPKELEPGKTYRVGVRGRIDGKAWAKTWSFATRP